ncbi:MULTISPECIES: hypothetical protein [unclassified Streptomyces]|uniref:hypothetical protein n=1 Tax=unclassified Streptomyces TaxID=2593676 RepID=UPI0011AA1E4E|nr:hypothetical protein [Streptomyces sp. BK340]TVZ92770.1 hypothetical protein FB157_10772 [Streptomyces sp. BK340]
MESQIVLGILGTASVASVLVYVLKGLLDQIPDLIRSWRRVVREARTLRRGAAAGPDETGASPADPGNRRTPS